MKAIVFRDDTSTPVFKRFLIFKLNQLKSRNAKNKEVEKNISRFTTTIEQLNDKLQFKQLKIKEISKEVTESKKEMENLYRLVDIKEREERVVSAQLQLKQQELTAQKETTTIAVRTNDDNLIRLENAAETIKMLQEQTQNLKSELTGWKKYTLYAAIILIGIIIGLLVKVVG